MLLICLQCTSVSALVASVWIKLYWITAHSSQPPIAGSPLGAEGTSLCQWAGSTFQPICAPHLSGVSLPMESTALVLFCAVSPMLGMVIRVQYMPPLTSSCFLTRLSWEVMHLALPVRSDLSQGAKVGVTVFYITQDFIQILQSCTK